MQKKSIETYHHNGRKIVITNIPVDNDEISSFEIRLSLEKQIDEINHVADPQPEYHFKYV